MYAPQIIHVFIEPVGGNKIIFGKYDQLCILNVSFSLRSNVSKYLCRVMMENAYVCL